jgi:hypothetical protein
MTEQLFGGLRAAQLDQRIKTPSRRIGCTGGHKLSDLVVTQRRCNHSAFNGYHRTPSDYSSVRCQACGCSWRTKASYADLVKDVLS